MTHKFPDAEATSAALKHYWDTRDIQDSRTWIRGSVEAALNSYRTRTGIDLADVSEKLASGTHVLVPVECNAAMMGAGYNELNKIDRRLVTSGRLASVYRAMIRAAK